MGGPMTRLGVLTLAAALCFGCGPRAERDLGPAVAIFRNGHSMTCDRLVRLGETWTRVAEFRCVQSDGEFTVRAFDVSAVKRLTGASR